jgi:hypothetical protein
MVRYMHQYIIEAMVQALKPTLKYPDRAQQILERFWSDRMALVWDVRDVHTGANEKEVALTHDRRRVLHFHVVESPSAVWSSDAALRLLGYTRC